MSNALLRCTLLYCVVLLAPLQSEAQSPAPSMEWGSVSREELTMKSYPADTNAAALVLFDRGEAFMNDYLGFTYTRHRRIKIFAAAAYTWAANISLPIVGEEDRVEDIEGVTYRLGPDGKIITKKLDEESVFKEDFDSRRFRYRYTLPDLQPGCVVEWRYRIVTKNQIDLIEPWVFQDKEPILWSEYRVIVPNRLAYATVKTSDLPFFRESLTDTTQAVGGRTANFLGGERALCNQYLWVLRNAPALREEPFVATMDDYAARVELQLSEYLSMFGRVEKVDKTWEALTHDLLDDEGFGKRIDVTKKVRLLAQNLTRGLKSPEEKMAALYDYVRHAIVWNGVSRWFPTRDVDELLEGRKGNSADLTFLLMSLLESAGIASHPVMLSTREHGKIQVKYPMWGQFNRVIALAQAGAAKYLLDPTDPLRPYDLLPTDVLNTLGLIVKEGPQEWVTVISPKHFVHRTLADLALTEAGVLEGTLESMDEEYSSLAKRRTIVGRKEVEVAKDLFDADRSGVTIDSVWMTGKDSLDQPLHIGARISSGTYAQTAGDLIYINPVILDREYTNPFKRPARNFPVDFNYRTRHTSVVNLTIPDGYEIVEAPKDLATQAGSGDLRFSRKTAVEGRRIQTIIKFSIEKIEFSPSLYPDLKDFYERVTSWEAAQIVLHRKPPPPAKSRK